MHHSIYDHIFLIHLSVEGHLGSFHSLVVVALAAMNIGVFVSTWMGLEEIMLSEITQAERVNYPIVSLVEHKE